VTEATRFGRPHRHLRRTDSTNERARELAEAGAPSGMVVTADEQEAGRGRHGRVWSAPPGAALLYSALLRPLDRRHELLPLAVPLAVCEAIESLAPVSCAVKWPNDIWIEERKVAGVLIEARPPEWAVIGVGINLTVADDEFPRDLRWPATSLGHGAAPHAARPALDEALGRWVETPAGRVREEFQARDALRGRAVGWEGAGDPADGSGTAAGIDDDGNLRVKTAAGEVALGAGEVSLRLR
jgi:BirA family transcriptional regulator, biotin operon repressor / biotin---[acetyl-CoA-carboxylase] ligase